MGRLTRSLQTLALIVLIVLIVAHVRILQSLRTIEDHTSGLVFTTVEDSEPDDMTNITAPPPRSDPEGWFDGSYDSFDDRLEARLLAVDAFAGLTVRCDTGNRPAEMTVHYDPFPDSNVGYSYRERWEFFTDGERPGLRSDDVDTLGEPIITEPLRHALLTEQWLIYEVDAHLGSQRRHPPLVYRYRATFDLTENREVVADVLERCGRQ